MTVVDGRHRLQRGFTLLELLVVLVIMSLVAGLTMVQMLPDDHSRLRDEARRLALLLENAELEARASGHAFAWSYDERGYRFWMQDRDGEWTDAGDAVLRRRTLPDGVGVATVEIEKQALRPGELLVFNSAAFSPPFNIRLQGRKVAAVVNGNGANEVSVRMMDERHDGN